MISMCPLLMGQKGADSVRGRRGATSCRGDLNCSLNANCCRYGDCPEGIRNRPVALIGVMRVAAFTEANAGRSKAAGSTQLSIGTMDGARWL